MKNHRQQVYDNIEARIDELFAMRFKTQDKAEVLDIDARIEELINVQKYML